MLEEKNLHKINRASSNDSAQQVYKLRYESFRSINALSQSTTEEFKDEYDEQSNSISYLYSHNLNLVGSVRACLYNEQTGWKNIPALETHSEDIDREIGSKKSILESTRFVIDPVFQKSGRFPLYLTRAIFLNNKIFKPDYVVTIVNPEQSGFYQRVMNFKEISPPREYNRLDVPPGVLLAIKGEDLDEVCNDSKIFSISESQIDHYKNTGELLS